jgi:hypothetical protein
MLVDKTLAVVKAEILTFQDFEDYLPLSRIDQPSGEDADRQQAFQCFVEHALLRQETEVSQHLSELDQQPGGREKLGRVMQEQELWQPNMPT